MEESWVCNVCQRRATPYRIDYRGTMPPSPLAIATVIGLCTECAEALLGSLGPRPTKEGVRDV